MASRSNERIKRKYLAFLKEAKRHSEPTIDATAKALSRFEIYSKFRDFKTFHFEQAIAFKSHLAEQKGQRSGEKLSKATLLTGARDRAIASMKLKHIDLAAGCVNQDAREVQTKFSKTFTTYLFPATLIAVGASQHFEAAGLDRKHWSTASPIRTIFKKAFIAAGLPYFNPHSFRNTLARFGEQVCKTPEQFKVWSQNLGHEKVLTTFLSYGEVACPRQGEIIRDLANPQEPMKTDADGIADAVFERLTKAGMHV